MVVLDGFFPVCDARARPYRTQSGLRDWGLPYAADSAITRHLITAAGPSIPRAHHGISMRASHAVFCKYGFYCASIKWCPSSSGGCLSDHEHKRYGTLGLLAEIDLVTGKRWSNIDTAALSYFRRWHVGATFRAAEKQRTFSPSDQVG